MLGLIGLIITVTFVVMLGIVWFNEGWKKALKIIGAFITSAIIISILEVWLHIEVKSTRMIISFILYTAWNIGLIIYNFMQGYIGKL